MQVIYAGRGEGKTTKCIEIANQTGAYLVVRSRDLAADLSPQTQRYPITYAELRDTLLRGSWVKNIVIDDADAFIESLFARDVTIEAISINKEP